MYLLFLPISSFPKAPRLASWGRGGGRTRLDVHKNITMSYLCLPLSSRAGFWLNCSLGSNLFLQKWDWWEKLFVIFKSTQDLAFSLGCSRLLVR